MRWRYLLGGAAFLVVMLGILAMRLAGTGPIIRTLALTEAPTAVGVDTRTGRAFVTTSGTLEANNGHVLVLESETGVILLSVTLGYRPAALTVDEQGSRVFVASQGSLESAGWAPPGPGIVTLLDAGSGRVVRTIALSAAAQALAVDERTGHLFLVIRGRGTGRGTVSMRDATSGRLLHTASVGVTPSAIAVDDQTEHVFVTNFLSNSVSVLDGRSGRVLQTDRLGSSPGTLLAVAVDSRTKSVFALSAAPLVGGGLGHLAILATTTGRVVQSVALRNPYALAVDQRTGHALVGCDKSVCVLDGVTGLLLRTIPMGSYPTAIATDPRTAHAFVATIGTWVLVPDSWAWIPGWLRRRVPFLPPPGTHGHDVPPGIRVIDLSRQ